MTRAATGSTRPARLDILDALRGSALLGILLLHAVEHWDFMRFPQGFYSFGLGMYRYVGPFMALGFGVCVFALQWAFARWWLARYAYGPLEWLWRAATLRVPPLRPAAGTVGASP